MIDLHVHSSYSDGTAGVEEIARKAREMRLKAIAIVDHSIELHFGLTESKAKLRQIDIDNASSLYGLKIYSGIECGINAIGEISLPDFDFDFVIASVHEPVYGEDYYRRLLGCMERYEEVDVIGHPFSKLFGFDGRMAELDEKVLDVAEQLGIAIEVNSSHKSPPDHFLELCRGRKILYSVGSDAHTLAKIGDVGWSFEKAKKYMTGAKLFNP
ncbi:PHP domain-containing protein [Archaeoglobus neptunius]|uniref:PHP domain-containing protein n=1 Tax=Archaeoglobus neptunius TaxID=2798580 RepID=UPI001926D1C8